MMKFITQIYSKEKLLRVFLIMAVVTLGLVVVLWDGWNKSFKAFILTYIWAFTICLTQWIGQVYINYKLSEKFDWKTEAKQRVFVQSIVSALYSGVAFILVHMLMSWLINGNIDGLKRWIHWATLIAVLISFVISLIHTTFHFFKSWKDSIIQSEQLKTQMMAYKYEALQNQINPHFLFNSFNVLSDLVYEDQAKAVKFIQQMSKLFRYVLDNRDKELVPLLQEEKFIRSYCYLLQNRFEDKLSVEYVLNAKEDEMVIPMGLQLLVENCVKHNIVSSKQPLSIKITQGDDYITVFNNLQEKSAGATSNNLGLSNIKQQYQFFTDKPVLINKTDSSFEVSIPILKMQAP